ncbi:hypothetical protein [Nocardioides solisilvae]|uniref:hypothetical protein n=1 Tax=Nocardioides solisilvae TaxID=1542435 RepID=UPI001EF60F9A|nr:hypothetical protein [Nocardioides solisilvae]
MPADDLTATAWLCLGLLAAAVLAAATGWRWQRSPWLGGLQVVLLLATAGAGALRPGLLGAPDALPVAVRTTCVLLAVLGGGPLTTAVFRLVDGREDQRPGSVRRAAEVLRGGAWIGALERGAVVVSVLLRWPEGIAVSLAVKGLGRYPELRNEEHTGIAERFLIGTFVSVLWAAACAGTALLLCPPG